MRVYNSIFKLGRHVDWWWTMESRGSSLVGLGWLGFENCWWSIDSEPLPKLHILINLAYLFRSDRPTLSQFLEVSVCCVLHQTTKMGVALASLCGTFANFEPRSSDTKGSQRRWDVELHACACPFCLANAKTNSNHNIFASSLLGKESRAIQVVHVDLCFCVSVWSEAEDGPPPGFSRSWSWAWCSWRLSGVVSIGFWIVKPERDAANRQGWQWAMQGNLLNGWGPQMLGYVFPPNFSRGSEQVCSSIAWNDTERYGTHVQHVT